MELSQDFTVSLVLAMLTIFISISRKLAIDLCLRFLSKYLKDCFCLQVKPSKSFRGTEPYVAPEIVEFQSYNKVNNDVIVLCKWTGSIINVNK